MNVCEWIRTRGSEGLLTQLLFEWRHCCIQRGTNHGAYIRALEHSMHLTRHVKFRGRNLLHLQHGDNQRVSTNQENGGLVFPIFVS